MLTERQLPLRHNTVWAFPIRVSQPIHFCVRACGHVTVFIQHLVYLTEIRFSRFLLCDRDPCGVYQEPFSLPCYRRAV